MNVDLKERIIIKASGLFERHGIKTITMDYIAAQMGISKRTLYENFRDKDQLLLESILYCQKVTERDAEVMKQTAENSLDLLLKIYQVSWKKMNEINRNYFRDIKRYHPSVYQTLEDQKECRTEFMTELMDQGKREGLIRPVLKSGIVASLLAAQFDFLFNSDEIFTSEYSFMEVYETIFMNFIRGIATLKGVAFIDEFMEKTEWV